MKTMKTKIILVCLILLSTNLFAQENSTSIDRQASIPIQSPNVAALNKFVEFPVSYFNGQVDVSFPLYEIKLRDINIPITLKYHTGGIRVTEEASWVGLGWALNAGGVISHQINGLDDQSGINPYQGRYLPFLNQADNENYHETIMGRTLLGIKIPNNTGVLEDIFSVFYPAPDNIDGEPDLYMYNMGNYSGKFTKWNGQFVDLSCNNIIFKSYPIGSHTVDSIIATTPDGYIYKFKDIEKSFTVTGAPEYSFEAARPKSTAYYLTEILSLNGESIKFHYKTFKQICDQKSWASSFPNYHQTGSYTDYYPSAPTLAESYFSATCEEDIYNDYSYTRSKSYTFSRTLHLEEIEFPNGIIEFEKSPRLDTYGLKLDRVNIKNSMGNKVTTFVFTYEYFNGATPIYGQDVLSATNVLISINPNYPESYAEKRLKLVSFSELGEPDGSDAQKYQFVYENASSLPYKTSFAQDLWGYYNKKMNTTLLPSYTLHNYTLGIPSTFSQYATANRNVDTYAAKAGMLKEIIYPTSGKTAFEFESNRCVNFLAPAETTSVTHTIVDTSVGYVEKTFTLDTITNADIYVDLVKRNPQVNPGTYDGIRAHYLFAQIEKYNETSRVWQIYKNYFWGGSLVEYVDNGYIKVFKDQTFETGTYKMTVNFPDNQVNLGALGSNMANLVVVCYTPIIREDHLVGGLRIKRITHTDPATNRKKTTNFTYKKGFLATQPSFVYSYEYPRCYPPYGDITKLHKIHLLTHPLYPYSFSANGSLVGYRNVIETLSNGDVGRTEYDYYMEADAPGAWYSGLPGIPHTVKLTNGFMSAIRIYNQEQKLIQKKTYSPITINTKVYWGFRVNPGIQYYEGYALIDVRTAISPYMKTYFYPIIQGKVLLANELEELYTNTTSSPITKRITYNYYSNGLLGSKVTRDNSSSFINETYSYAFGKTHESGIYNQMVSHNMINTVVEKGINRNGYEIKEKTNYSQPYQKIFTPSTIQQQKGGNSLDTRIVFERYDRLGNPVSINKDGIGSTIYLWGYNGQYPIAEIKNSTYSDVETAAQTLGLNLEFLSTTNSPDMNKVNALRSQLNNAHVTTYTYKPLIGITSRTDPAEKTTYYDYDSHNRLKEVFIYNGNTKEILEAYEYNYVNQ